MRELFYNLRFFISDTSSSTITYKVLAKTYSYFIELIPYLIAGLVFSILLKRFLTIEKAKTWLSGRKHGAIIIFSLLSLLSPFCTYTMVPLLAVLAKGGISAGPLAAFLIGSPLMNPNLFMLTLGAFGWQMAIVRVISVFLLSVSAGYIVSVIDEKKLLSYAGFKPFTDELLTKARLPRAEEKIPFLMDFYYDARTIFKFFFIGILLAAFIEAIVDPKWIISIAKTAGDTFEVLFAVALGIPLYNCGGGSIPIAASLMDLGLSKGAVLGFFLSGPATKPASIGVLLLACGSRWTIFYMIISLAGALILGTAYNLM